jgi:hypothetical protein
MTTPTNPSVRTEISAEILTALTAAERAMTAAQLADACPSAADANEIAKIAYEMRVKKGLIEFGEDALERGKRAVKTYQIVSTDSAEAWAARTAASAAVALAQAPKKTKKTSAYPAPPAHPWLHAALPPKTVKPARVTRPLPTHLQTPPPPPAPAEAPLAHHCGHVGTLAADPVATSPVITHETPLDAPQTDLDAALIAALKHVLPAMQRAAADLPTSIETTPEESPMSEPTATYRPDTDPGAAPDGLVWARQGAGTAPATFTATPDLDYIPDPAAFVLTPETELATAPVADPDTHPAHPGAGCAGHCANHAREQERQALADAVARDLLENCRLAIVDAMLLHAHGALATDRVWQALAQAYQAAAGETLEMCHG